ncbi:MAG: nucleotidyltransferase domain-containing protein [Pseudomonadota bacterium]|nr:nucleotidyltransferase domain-containing protein [Pseudomonadota bacterium]
MPASSKPRSHLRYPLTSILGSAGNVRVLRAIAADPSPQSVPQLAAVAGLTPQGTRLVLDAFARQRLVLAHGTGRAKLYALNSSHPFAGAIVALFENERRRWDALLESVRQILIRHGEAVSAAWLYGSVARGEDLPGSDLDIAVLVRSQAVADRLREDLMPLEDEQALRISLTALTPEELAAVPEDDPWWSDVVRDGRVLKGSAPDQVRRRLVRSIA